MKNLFYAVLLAVLSTIFFFIGGGVVSAGLKALRYQTNLYWWQSPSFYLVIGMIVFGIGLFFALCAIIMLVPEKKKKVAGRATLSKRRRKGEG